jgi:hypothetical protein
MAAREVSCLIESVPPFLQFIRLEVVFLLVSVQCLCVNPFLMSHVRRIDVVKHRKNKSTTIVVVVVGVLLLGIGVKNANKFI